jgi:hypothetical protein
MIEIAGPDQIRQDELVRQYLKMKGDSRNVVTDDNAGYFGIKVNDHSLIPGKPRIGVMHFNDWLKTPKA